MSNFYNLAEFFYHTANENKEATAIKYRSYSINYNDLNKKSNQIANYFISLGVKQGDVVGIINTKTILGYACMLAALKIGAAYTNIDISNPLSRTESIINTCRIKLLISDADSSETESIKALSEIVDLIYLNPDLIKYEKYSDINLKISKEIIGTTPAYIMFTSGSTGNPKGVTISHANVISFIGWSISKYAITRDDVFAQISPMYFDNSVFDFYTALFSGASIVPVKREELNNARKLLDLIDSMACTIWFSVPSLLVYLQTLRVLNDRTLQSIRIFTFGGEGYPKSELQKLFKLYGNKAKFINVYGPTEATCICSSYEVTEKDFGDMTKLSSLGSINPNFGYLILDENLEEVKSGDKGELCLIGPNIALGYYNDLDRTSQKFIQNPKINTHTEIIYRTGDIVYEDSGLLWFSGRVDNQIKHMGYRIELEEIEAAINSISVINQSAVVYQRVNVNYGKIIAHVSTKSDITELQLKNNLREVLPSYMIPSIIKLVDFLPTNPNGKVDKAKLKHV